MDVIDQLQASFDLTVKLDIAFAVSAVPEPVVTLSSIGFLIVYEEHVLFSAVKVNVHCGFRVFLPYVPEDFIIRLFEVELRPGKGPELAEIELEGLSLIPESAQELPVQRHKIDLRFTASYVEHAVLKLFACEIAGEIV